jgi:hypothetical protein
VLLLASLLSHAHVLASVLTDVSLFISPRSELAIAVESHVLSLLHASLFGAVCRIHADEDERLAGASVIDPPFSCFSCLLSARVVMDLSRCCRALEPRHGSLCSSLRYLCSLPLSIDSGAAPLAQRDAALSQGAGGHQLQLGRGELFVTLAAATKVCRGPLDVLVLCTLVWSGGCRALSTWLRLSRRFESSPSVFSSFTDRPSRSSRACTS